MARQVFNPAAEYEIKPGALPFEAVAGNIPADVKAWDGEALPTIPGEAPTAEAVAGQVRTELTPELALIDVAISSRGTSTLAAGAAMTLTAAYDAAKAAATQESVDAAKALLDRVATITIGDVTGAATGTEVFTYDAVTGTVTVDDDGNRSIVWS